MNNRAPATAIVALILLGVLGGVAYKFYRDRHTNNVSVSQPGSELTPTTPSEPQSPTNTPTPTRHHDTVIYTVSADGGGDDNGLVPQLVSSHAPFTARTALHALISADNSPLPQGTELRGIKIEDGLASVDFSREFASNFHGGDTQEAQTVNSILLTLGQFPTIDRVQILVEGKPIDALSQLPINAPLDVIRGQPVRQAQGGGSPG